MLRRPVVLLFLALIGGVPLGQAGWELARGEGVQALEVIGPPREPRLRVFEEDLRRASFLHQHVTPGFNRLLFELFGRGNEKVLPLGDGRLHYGADLDYLTRRVHFAQQAATAAIDLRDRLAGQGIGLLLVLVDPKSAFELAPDGRPIAVPAREAFLGRIERAGIEWVDLPENPAYLPRDTHWTPETMQRAAARTAARAQELLGGRPRPSRQWKARRVDVRGPGDLVGMLHWPEGFHPHPDMQLRLEAVSDGDTGEPFGPDRSAEVLLLGDSFARVFSDPALGLGEGAGFDAQLARALGAGLDVIASPGGSALGVRQALARRPGALAGKRLVIWQLSLRDLAADAERWRPVPLGVGAAGPEASTPTGRRPLEVEVEIVEKTEIPRGFDYPLLLAVYEYRVLRTVRGDPPQGPLWVAHVVIRDLEQTPAAAWEVGTRQRLSLEPVEAHYDLELTAWWDDTDAGLDIWFATSVEPLE